MDGWVVHLRGARTGLAGRYRLSASEGMRTRPERAIVCGARLDHARMFERASDGTAASGPPFVFSHEVSVILLMHRLGGLPFVRHFRLYRLKFMM